MKKIFTIASVFALGLVITFACKKSTTTTTPPATTSTSTTGPNTSVTSLSVDGTAINSLTVSASPMNSTEYMIVVNSTTTTFPVIYLTFPGTSVPASGAYTCSTYSSYAAPTANHCYFQDHADAASNVFSPSSGQVTVTTGTPNIAVFSNLICTSTTTTGTHTITGVFRF
jgi:hypothetical protein